MTARQWCVAGFVFLATVAAVWTLALLLGEATA